jgi:hypothetical protein
MKTTSKAPEATIDYPSRDARHWQRMEALIQSQGFRLKDALRYFPAYVRRRELPRFLAHYELFKQIVDLPGSIVEVGVYRGAGLFTWTKLMETFCPGDRYRMVYGFDQFSGLTQYTDKDGPRDEETYSSSAEAMRTLVDVHNQDSLIPGVERCRLIEGDVLETLPQFVKDHPGLRIALLNLDVDLYAPTKVALETLYPLVLKGGIVVFDEYGWEQWPGESRAVDEYFGALGEQPAIHRFPFSPTPGGYMVKR